MSADRIPLVDKKIIASWNAQMICAYFDAYRYLGDTRARDFALRTMDFILNNMISETEGVAHTHARDKASVYGLLADQVTVAVALIDSYEVSIRREYLETAESLMNYVEIKYLDQGTGLYVDWPEGGNRSGLLSVPRIPVFDNPMPSANAVAAIAWYRLFQITHNESYREKFRRMVDAMSRREDLIGLPGATFGTCLLLAANGAPKALIVGLTTDEETSKMHTNALDVFRMGKSVEVLDPEAAAQTDYPPSKDGKPIAYVCTDKNCAPPVREADKIGDVLKSFGKPGGTPSGSETSPEPE
jgi:uncharacterized protein YyaL (SSP411 family)